MAKVIIFSSLTGISLMLGTAIGALFKINQKMIAAIMAFGSGVMVCALTFGLMEEAFKYGGFDAIIIGFLSGGIVFIAGDYIIHLFGGRHYKKKKSFKPIRQTNGKAIVLGALLDGIPESIALGISLFAKNGIGVLMVGAIFLSNLPESLSSVDDLEKEGFSKKQIHIMWVIVSIIVIVTTILSYLFLKDLNSNILGIILSFASGAILAMLSDSMIPEAFEEGGYLIGILTILGFLTAFILYKV
ncbi:MAG: ZIP family zinc transporter [Actinomycetota bacterium]|nr:ZIP family zinc transporter [Actinomycetota bacterium]